MLRALTATLTFFIFLTYGLTNVLIYYLRHDLGQSYAWAAGRYGVGPVCAASGAGCLLIAAAALFTPIRLPAPVLESDTA